MRIAFLTLILATTVSGQPFTFNDPVLAETNGLATAAGGGAYQPDIAWWKFAEGSGTTVADASTRGTNTLTLSSASMWAAGGTNISGNGTSYYAQCANFNAATNVITISFWKAKPSWVNYEYLVELSAAFESNQGTFALDNGQYSHEGAMHGTPGTRSENQAVPAGTGWKHWLWVLDAAANEGVGDIKLYIDGVEQTLSQGTNTKNDTGNFISATLNILARNGAQYFSNASLDDVRIYSGDRSADVSGIMGDRQ